MDRRDLLRGGALLAGFSLPRPAFSSPVVAPEDLKIRASRSSMAAAPGAVGDIVYLSEPGREGLFSSMGGAAPGGDPLQGLYIPTTNPDRHFARIWDSTNARPEWFGAKTNDWHFDCADAIEACVALCPVSHLGQADYFVRRTVVLNRNWRTVIGTGTYATNQGQGTRIILQGQAANIHDADIMLVGSLRQPAATNEGFPFEIHLARFTLIRDGTSMPHPSGELRHYPAGLRASFLTRCTFSQIASLESSVGFYFGGTVYTKVDDCLAQRLRPGAGRVDLAAGFYLDGSPQIGLAGGNASLYLDRCLTVGQHASHVLPTGLVLDGAFVDSFIDRFESARVDNAIRVSARGAPNPGQTIDLHIRNCVLDGCGNIGIELDLSGTASASIEIIDPYVYAAGTGGKRGIVVRDGGGLITVTGGQVHGDFADASLLLDRTRGVRIQGLKLHEGSQPVVLRDCGPLQIEPQISNLKQRTANFAIATSRVHRTAFRPMILGTSGMLAGGISIDAQSSHCSVDVTAIDPASFVDAAMPRTLWFNGVDASQGAGAAAFARAANSVIGIVA